MTNDHAAILRLILANQPNRYVHIAKDLYEAADEIERLQTALINLLDHYVKLVESGDCGFWDAEKEPVVIAARAALGKSE